MSRFKVNKILERRKTPRGAATAFYNEIVKACLAEGLKPEIETALWSPAEAARRGYARLWTVVWESGPYEWAITEAGKQSHIGTVYVEPYNSHMLTFCKT